MRAARLAVFAFAAMALSVAPSPAVAQGVQYTLMPSTSYARWDESLGLERSLFFGARALADFGALVGLEGHYLQGGGVRSRFAESGLTDSLGVPLANSSLDVTNYGAALRVNLGRRSLAPFLRAGGSVLRFDNGGANRLRQIAVSYGGGLRIDATPRIRAELFAEDMRFRLDRTALAAGATPGTDPRRNDLRSNLVFGGGVGFVVGGGGGRSADMPRERWSVASIPLEPFAGRIDFAEAGRGPQSLVGLRAGVDVGNYVGLRAFYMRGVTSDYSTFAGVRSVGGEAQFNLNAAPRFAPYLVLGGGSLALDAGSGGAPPPADRTVLILGGGMGFRLTDKFRLNVAARDFVAGRQTAFGDVSRARDLEHNWLYSAGVTLSVGRSRRGIAVLPTAPRAALRTDSTTATVIARGDSAVRGDSVTRDSVIARSATLRATADSVDARTYHSATTVLLPIPTEGELYIRYGPPGPRSDSLRARVGAADTLAERRPPSMLDAAVADDLARGDARLASALRQALADRWRADSLMIRGLIAEELRRQPDAARAVAVPVVPVAPVAVQVAPAPLIAPAGADAAVVSALVADRDRARADALRLQERLDSLEAAIGERAAARDAEARGAALAREAQRDAATSAAALADSASAAAAARSAAAADRADSAAAMARASESAQLERRRSDALLILERSVPSVTAVRESERGLVIVLGNSLFATGATTLPARTSVELRAVAAMLALYPDAQLAVEGHTDNTGPAELNQRLSEARAEAVRRALVSYGVGSERLTARGYGQDRPLADNATATGRAANRRAEVVVLGVRRPPPVTTR